MEAWRKKQMMKRIKKAIYRKFDQVVGRELEELVKASKFTFDQSRPVRKCKEFNYS